MVIFGNVEISLTRTDVPQAGIEKNFRNETETNSTIEIIIMEASHVTININNAMPKEITDSLTKLQEDQIDHVTRIDMVLTVIIVVLEMILDVMTIEDDHSILIDLSIHMIHVINPTVMTSHIVVEIATVTSKVA